MNRKDVMNHSKTAGLRGESRVGLIKADDNLEEGECMYQAK